MAYRRKQGLGRSSTFKEEMYQPPADLQMSTSSSSSSLSAQAAIRTSRLSSTSNSKGGGGPTYDYTSMGSSNETGSFWGVLARKAKAILEEDNESAASNSSRSTHEVEGFKNVDSPGGLMGMDGFNSMNRTGNAMEEACTIVENKTADFVQETQTPQIRRKGFNFGEQKSPGQQQNSGMNHTSPEDQLKASRDVAMATAAKAKLLLRELKTVKADLAFAKQRCSQLEEENKILREAREKGVNPADDDMIRLQLETLLAEKARLAHENSVYARENRFLREIVEYHQLTKQDVVCFDDEGIEDVTELFSNSAVFKTLSAPSSPSTSPGSNLSTSRPLWRTSSMDAAARFSMDVPTLPKRGLKTNTKAASPIRKI